MPVLGVVVWLLAQSDGGGVADYYPIAGVGSVLVIISGVALAWFRGALNGLRELTQAQQVRLNQQNDMIFRHQQDLHTVERECDRKLEKVIDENQTNAWRVAKLIAAMQKSGIQVPDVIWGTPPRRDGD